MIDGASLFFIRCSSLCCHVLSLILYLKYHNDMCNSCFCLVDVVVFACEFVCKVSKVVIPLTITFVMFVDMQTLFYQD